MGRRALIKISQHLAPIESEAQDNYATNQGFGGDTVHTQTQSNAADVAVSAVALPVKYSGIFRVSVQAGYASGTTAKTVRHKVVLLPFAPPIASPIFAATGGILTDVFFGSDVGIDTTIGGREKWGARLNADAAGVSNAGLTFNGVAITSGAAGAVTATDTGATPTLTGLLSGAAMGLAFDAPVSKAVATKVPFTVGNILVAALVLVSTAGGDVVTYEYVNVSMEELPIA